MGRTRSFDETTVVAAAAAAFRTIGYEGTSVDDLVGATGLHRGSIYQAFGSKRGLFVAALRQTVGPGALADDDSLDLILVATLELAPHDAEVRLIVGTALDVIGVDPVQLLGRRLLDRAQLGAAGSTTVATATHPHHTQAPPDHGSTP